MAELHVQEKDRSAWPWILAAVLVLALLFWYFQARGNSGDVATAGMTDSTLVGNAPDGGLSGSAAGTLDGTAVTQYLAFVDNRATRDAGASHDYTADGLRQLAAALREVAAGDNAGGVAVQPRIDEINQRADAMQQNAASSEHALQTREAFGLAAALIAQMRGSASDSAATGSVAATGSAGADAAATGQGSLQQAAMSIEPSRPLLEQTELVDRFFAEAADELRALIATRR